MNSTGRLPGKPLTRLLESQLAPYVDALGNYLIERRYTLIPLMAIWHALQSLGILDEPVTARHRWN